MKRVATFFFFLSTGYCALNTGWGTEYWAPNTATAKDFGTHGHTFEIQEPDLLKKMESKLKGLEADGKLAELNNDLAKRAQRALNNPKPVAGITKAIEPREFFYDPSITVPYDLKDHEGRVFHKAGTRINPLEFRSLSAPLVFIDGQDKAQVAWTQNTYIKTNQHPKIILTSGSPFELMKQWQDNPEQTELEQQTELVYFDQGGTLTSKLGIRHVPAVVVQDGFKLKISEIVVEDKVLEEDKQ